MYQNFNYFNRTSSKLTSTNELTIDADTITATDDFIIDAVGEITLDADNSGIIYLKDAGTIYGQFFQSSNNPFNTNFFFS